MTVANKGPCPVWPYNANGLVLRALRQDDFPAFLAYRSDPRVARYQGWQSMDANKARSFLREHCRCTGAVPGRWVQCAIADARTDRLLGDLGLWRSLDGGQAEIGITVTPTAQGRGIGRSAVRAALEMWFADPELESVQAFADARNTPCRRMLAAVGFQDIGSADVFVKEEACIEHRYRIDRAQFAQISNGRLA